MTSQSEFSSKVRVFRLVPLAQIYSASDPHDLDARYVHFFHERIPSRYGCVPRIPLTMLTLQPQTTG